VFKLRFEVGGAHTLETRLRFLELPLRKH